MTTQTTITYHGHARCERCLQPQKALFDVPGQKGLSCLACHPLRAESGLKLARLPGKEHENDSWLAPAVPVSVPPDPIHSPKDLELPMSDVEGDGA